MMSAKSAVIQRLPSWFKQEIPGNAALEIQENLSSESINTVCQEAHCPNLARCFKNKKLTFLILGKRCSRSCFFCAVEKGLNGNSGIDSFEPERIARTVRSLGLKYVVITSVTRDDLADGGAAQFNLVVRKIRDLSRDVRVELLIPDFKACPQSLKAVIEVSPAVLGHNLETVARLYPELKPGCDYDTSLEVLRMAKKIDSGIITKSALLLGMGEERREVSSALKELKTAGCDIVVLGQYLSPGKGHYPVKEFIKPEVFRSYEEEARKLGFKAVIALPLARSSYRAEELYGEALRCAN